MTAYTIKPLVWKRIVNGWACDSYLIVEHTDGQFEWMHKTKANKWFKCDSLAHGKSLCQQHWESEAGIGKFLERVE